MGESRLISSRNEEQTTKCPGPEPANERDYDCVLLDIEGTTTPISFVHEVLFSYVCERLQEFIAERWNEEEMQSCVSELREQAQRDLAAGMEGAVTIPPSNRAYDSLAETRDGAATQHAVVENVKWQMGADRKSGPLKRLQGYIWKDGYASGALKGVVYEDVVPTLEHLFRRGKKVYIYSSGSVLAQKLLFKHSDRGNLLNYISGHFDTSVGQKVDSESYRVIAQSIKCEPWKVLFISDNPKELYAAREAGLLTVLAVRPGNAPLPAEDVGTFPAVCTFAELCKTES